MLEKVTCRKNENIYDAVTLGVKRIGHVTI
jgi:hypothetical protein